MCSFAPAFPPNIIQFEGLFYHRINLPLLLSQLDKFRNFVSPAVLHSASIKQLDLVTEFDLPLWNLTEEHKELVFTNHTISIKIECLKVLFKCLIIKVVGVSAQSALYLQFKVKYLGLTELIPIWNLFKQLGHQLKEESLFDLLHNFLRVVFWFKFNLILCVL